MPWAGRTDSSSRGCKGGRPLRGKGCEWGAAHGQHWGRAAVKNAPLRPQEFSSRSICLDGIQLWAAPLPRPPSTRAPFREKLPPSPSVLPLCGHGRAPKPHGVGPKPGGAGCARPPLKRLTPLPTGGERPLGTTDRDIPHLHTPYMGRAWRSSATQPPHKPQHQLFTLQHLPNPSFLLGPSNKRTPPSPRRPRRAAGSNTAALLGRRPLKDTHCPALAPTHVPDPLTM